MSAFRQQLCLWGAGVLAAVSVWACTATKTGDGGITLSFAPDMAITAYGLEDALKKLIYLLDDCVTGNFNRPCTDNEMAEINKAIEKVLEKKDNMRDPPSPPDGGLFGA